jgi:hypothetical protein
VAKRRIQNCNLQHHFSPAKLICNFTSLFCSIVFRPAFTKPGQTPHTAGLGSPTGFLPAWSKRYSLQQKHRNMIQHIFRTRNMTEPDAALPQPEREISKVMILFYFLLTSDSWKVAWQICIRRKKLSGGDIQNRGTARRKILPSTTP